MSGATLYHDQDLRTFLTTYRQAHPEDVLVIEESLSTDQDLTALARELAARGHHELLICPHVSDANVPVVANMFASRTRIARLLGCELEQLHVAYQLACAGSRPPRVVDSGPVLATVVPKESVDLDRLTLLKHFDGDAAPYVTSGVVYAEHPDTGLGNLSYHRAMVKSSRELATSLHSRGDLWRMVSLCAERGTTLPVAMVIGGHPLFMLAASARVPMGVDEREIAGGLFGAPLDVVRTPRYGLGVPASAELVLEGFIDPGRTLQEGPFGEFSGYSSHRSTNSCFEVEAVLHREHPLLVDVITGNSDDHLNLARLPREAELAERLKGRFPNVIALHYPRSGTHFHCYVALRQTRPGEARQVLLALLGWDPYVKTAVAVDADVDITDDGEVLWALATHFQPGSDLFVIEGLPGSPLDPSSSLAETTSRLGLDATRGPGFTGSRVAIRPGARERAKEICAKILW